MQQDYAEVARTGQAKRFVDYNEGLQRWFDVFVFPMHGAPHRLAAIFSDVTERKQTEVGLRESEERLRRMMNVNAGGVP